ncbi:hypothetical protein F5Y13DRAFT_196163 [Hypoxylon sp. FL1857]|nr:hypothetical protein F5Y13DRAFT_196163 [Hypoxylon sp. FL1857]
MAFRFYKEKIFRKEDTWWNRQREMDRREYELIRKKEEIACKEYALVCREEGREGQEVMIDEPSDLDIMVMMLSRQWTDDDEDMRRYHPSNSREPRKGASDEQISALEQTLDVRLPRDYKAFLQLTDGTERFWYGGRPNTLFSDFSRVQRVEQNESIFLSAIIGVTALHGIQRELAESADDTTSASVTIQLLQIDNYHRVFLVDPATCRTVARRWGGRLSRLNFSDEVEYEALKYSADHFGNVPIFRAMMLWTNWVVLEVRERMEGRLYPSFTDFLEEIVARQTMESTSDRASESKVAQNARIAIDDRRRWEHALRRYSVSKAFQ